MMALPRREFLWRALAACGTAATVASRPVDGAQSGGLDRVRSARIGYFGDQADAVRAIGEAYVRQVGRDLGDESVRAAARGALDVIDRSSDPSDAIRALVKAVRQDFERGRSVQVGGWVLSRTEAELCALTLLADDSRA
jgi:hypothetical protein